MIQRHLSIFVFAGTVEWMENNITFNSLGMYFHFEFPIDALNVEIEMESWTKGRETRGIANQLKIELDALYILTQ